MNSSFRLIGVFVLSTATIYAARFNLHEFEKTQLTKEFWAEGACFGDFNQDGKQDIAYGPHWYEGPKFTKRSEYRSANQTFKRKANDGTEETIQGFEGGLGVKNSYSETFLMYAFDFNADGWADILVYGFPGKEAAWYENPRGRAGHWQKHTILNVLDNESPSFGDVTGDGRPEIICCSEGYIGYAEADWKHPDLPWKFRPVSPKGPYQRFTHGLGFGDVNGDGRVDLLEKDGWWEQPKSLAENSTWEKHSEDFGKGGAQMFAYDVNGDGLNDVITSLAAHEYGLAWFEQRRDGDRITFAKHLFVNKSPSENNYGVAFSQPHAMDMMDMDGDGLKDILTGKRFWAHGPDKDPEPNAPAVLYWFKLARAPMANDASFDGAARPREKMAADFVPMLIDNDSGVGTQVMAGNINGDKLPDVLVGNKKGAFVFIHKVRKVSRSAWEKAQPKPITPVKDASK